MVTYGGLAKGMPLKAETDPSDTPTNVPLSSRTVGFDRPLFVRGMAEEEWYKPLKARGSSALKDTIAEERRAEETCQ